MAAGARGGLLERHEAFLRALRGAGLPVSLAEDLDAVAALQVIGWHQRETVRAAYAATVVKRAAQRPAFDTLFDLYFPRLLGAGAAEGLAADAAASDDAAALRWLRDRLSRALASAEEAELASLATEAVGRFGAMPGRGPGLSSWSAYTAVQRVAPAELIGQVVRALIGGGTDADAADAAEAALQRRVERAVAEFTRHVEDDARRRIAEEKGPDHVAAATVRPALDQIDFVTARRAELEELRRQIHPLARRLASRMTRERHAHGRGPLDVRRTVRTSMSTGGVPLVTRHRPRRPHRTELVVLCDVSGSVASFAQFTLMLVVALREQFRGVRAFTFVDDLHEVTHLLSPGNDLVDTLAALAAETDDAATWGRTSYGRALTRFADRHPDAVGPATSLLVLGDARSNYGDLALPILRELVGTARHAWWLNPERRSRWGTGDSAAPAYGELIAMVECRNLAQLSQFVHALAR